MDELIAEGTVDLMLPDTSLGVSLFGILSGKEKIVQLDEGEVYGSVFGSSERVTIVSGEPDKEKNKSYYYCKDKWPLLFYTRGPLASLILSLHLQEYVEFCAVKRSSLLVNGTCVVRMPGSREEVMMEGALTVSEKRRLFKVMKSVMLDGVYGDGDGDSNRDGDGSNGDSNCDASTTLATTSTVPNTTSNVPNTTSNNLANLANTTSTWLRDSFDVSADSRLGQLIFYCALRCPSLSHALSLPLPSALRALKALQGGLAAVGTDLVTCAWSGSELAQAAGRGVALRGAVQVMSATDCVEARRRLSRRDEVVVKAQPGYRLRRWTVLVEGDSSFLGGECELFVVPPRSDLNETDWTLNILQLPSETGYCSAGSVLLSAWSHGEVPDSLLKGLIPAESILHWSSWIQSAGQYEWKGSVFGHQPLTPGNFESELVFCEAVKGAAATM